MSNVILMPTQLKSIQYRFAVYELPVTDNASNIFTERFIVIKNQYGVVIKFTGLENYSNPFTGKKQPRRTRSKHELHYICGALNSIMLEGIPTNNAPSVARISIDTIFNYFDHCRTTPIKNGNLRGQQSIDKCVRAVSSFFANAALAAGAIAVVDPTELFVETYEKAYRASNKVTMKYQPIYQEKAKVSRNKPILRDIPIGAMEMLLDVCRIHCPEIFFALTVQWTSGLRPSETLNMRRENSPLGRGLSMTMQGSTATKIEIDLRQEMLLRSDGKTVGKIKRERVQHVYPAFIQFFISAYQYHLHFLQGQRYEADYAPMFINRSGKAMTYKSYLQKFQNLVRDRLRPQLLESDNPELQIFAQRLLTEKLSPHALRHFFTVALVLRGEDIAQIQHYRGDSSPESALEYLKNKGALVREAGMVHTELIETLLDIGRKGNAPNL